MLRKKYEKVQITHAHMRARERTSGTVWPFYLSISLRRNKVYRSLSDVTESKHGRLICPLIRFVFLFLLEQVEF